jgi:hypothetical protein
MVVTLAFQCRFAGTQADHSLYQLHVDDTLHEGILFMRSCILHSKSNAHLAISIDWKNTHLFSFSKMLSFHVRSTFHRNAMHGYLYVLVDAHGVILWYSDIEIYVSCIGYIRHHLVLSSILWWIWSLLSRGHNHRSSTRLAVSGFDMFVANAWTPMVLTTASSRIYVCSVSVRGFLLVRALDSNCIRAMASGSRMVSVTSGYVRHPFECWTWSSSLLLFRNRERNWMCRLFVSTCSLGCLYPGNPIRARITSLFDTYSYEYASLPPGLYITHELDHDDSDDDHSSLGLGDFLIYNWTVLIGHIISVQMGCWTTHSLRNHWDTNMLPGVPCPVVFVSLYAFVVDHVYCILWTKESICPRLLIALSQMCSVEAWDTGWTSIDSWTRFILQWRRNIEKD